VYLKARLLGRSHYASGRSCDRPTRSRFSVVFLGPIANAKLVPQIHVAFHASHSTLPTLSKFLSICLETKFSPNAHIFMLHTPNSPLQITLPSTHPRALMLLPAYLYWKDERAMPEKI